MASRAICGLDLSLRRLGADQSGNSGADLATIITGPSSSSICPMLTDHSSRSSNSYRSRIAGGLSQGLEAETAHVRHGLAARRGIHAVVEHYVIEIFVGPAPRP